MGCAVIALSSWIVETPPSAEEFFVYPFYDMAWSKMNRRTLAYLIFAIGILLLGVHTTFAVLWQLTTGSSAALARDQATC